jgi:hypothetical protein
MSDNYTTTTSANDTNQNPLIDAAILGAARPAVVVADKVRYRNLPMGGPNSHTFSKFQKLVMADLGEATGVDASEVDTDGVTVSADLKVLDVLLGDLQRYGAIPTFEPGVLAELGKAAAEAIDKAVLALASGFSNDAGASGAAWSTAKLRAAMLLLDNGDAPDGNDSPPPVINGVQAERPEALLGKVFYGAPIHIDNLTTEIGASAAAMFAAGREAADVMYRTSEGGGLKPAGYAGTLYGIPHFKSTNAKVSSSDRVGMLIVPSAINVVIKTLAMYEVFRDLKGRAMRHGLTGIWGVAEGVDAYGVACTAKST